MIKMNNMAERMREHCSRIYWEVDDIEENIMFMIKELPNLEGTPNTRHFLHVLLN